MHSELRSVLSTNLQRNAANLIGRNVSLQDNSSKHTATKLNK